jgi:2-polyprenyl-3-methyl-5-hydroxy-6-metoxy-1,4-benzoquinol methylase
MTKQDLEYVNCNFCGSDKNEIVYEKDGFNMVKCNNCALVFVNPRLKQQSIEALYDEDYFRGRGFDKSIEYKREFDEKSKSQDLNDWDLSTIAEFLKECTAEDSHRLLDIGSGMGLFLWKAKKKGFDVEGLELSPYACDFVSSLGMKVKNSSIYDAKLENHAYSAIIMKEVIEHLPDPKLALKKVFSSLKKGGVLFLTTGNYNSPERRLKGKNWFYFMPEGHIYIFSNSTMKKYLEEAGFSRFYVTNQGDLVMNLLLRSKILEMDSFKPKNLIKRGLFEFIRGINHFISSGLRVYAVK